MRARLWIPALLIVGAVTNAAPAQSLGTVPAPEMQVAAPVQVAQVKDDLFAGTEKFSQGASEVNEINLDPKMMSMIGGKGTGADQLAHKMNFVVIHDYSYDKPGMYRPEDVEVYRKKLTDASWICAVHVKDKTGSTDICSRPSSDHESTELVILDVAPKELTFIHISGRMSVGDLEKMGSGMAHH